MLTPKTRFCRLKECFIAEKLFTVETSIFVEKKLYKCRFLFGGKDRFVIKNTSVNTENEVLSSKRVLYSWKTIYGGNLDFSREKIVQISVFIRWKRPFRNKKIQVLTPKTRFCRLKEYFIAEKLFYGGNLSFCREKLAEIPVFILWKWPFRNKKYKC